mmetsp:Transcript_21149/g.47637  ORF Transcript_21149/g.47637 Transcript_21149/m.47637 type:complete len:284 (-) Transcript_21149:341-1192(-)
MLVPIVLILRQFDRSQSLVKLPLNSLPLSVDLPSLHLGRRNRPDVCILVFACFQLVLLLHQQFVPLVVPLGQLQHQLPPLPQQLLRRLLRQQPRTLHAGIRELGRLVPGLGQLLPLLLGKLTASVLAPLLERGSLVAHKQRLPGRRRVEEVVLMPQDAGVEGQLGPASLALEPAQRLLESSSALLGMVLRRQVAPLLLPLLHADPGLLLGLEQHGDRGEYPVHLRAVGGFHSLLSLLGLVCADLVLGQAPLRHNLPHLVIGQLARICEERGNLGIFSPEQAGG